MGTGIHRKYDVTRTDGSSAPGGKHADCAYFVLDLNCDDHAIPALKAYIKSCRKTDPKLAADLQEIIEREVPRCNCREAFCPHAPMFGPTNHSEMAHYLMDSADRKVRK